MVKFNKDQILMLQQKMYKLTGQRVIVRDYDLLDSALESPFQTFGGYDLYPTIEEKGARLCYNIIKNHPFVDGNKRMGVLTMLCFFEINNIKLKYSNLDIIDIGLSLASGEKNYEDIVDWVNCHKTTMQQRKNSDEQVR